MPFLLKSNRIFDVLHFSYEYDPDRYEGDEQDKEVVSITKSSEEASTGTVISSTNAKIGDLDKQLSLKVIISILNFKLVKKINFDATYLNMKLGFWWIETWNFSEL